MKRGPFARMLDIIHDPEQCHTTLRDALRAALAASEAALRANSAALELVIVESFLRRVDERRERTSIKIVGGTIYRFDYRDIVNDELAAMRERAALAAARERDA